MRRIRRDADDIVNERFAEALMHNNGRDFWIKPKKIRRNKASLSSIVDRVCTLDGIANVFVSNYQHL